MSKISGIPIPVSLAKDPLVASKEQFVINNLLAQGLKMGILSTSESASESSFNNTEAAKSYIERIQELASTMVRNGELDSFLEQAAKGRQDAIVSMAKDPELFYNVINDTMAAKDLENLKSLSVSGAMKAQGISEGSLITMEDKTKAMDLLVAVNDKIRSSIESTNPSIKEPVEVAQQMSTKLEQYSLASSAFGTFSNLDEFFNNQLPKNFSKESIERIFEQTNGSLLELAKQDREVSDSLLKYLQEQEKFSQKEVPLTEASISPVRQAFYQVSISMPDAYDDFKTKTFNYLLEQSNKLSDLTYKAENALTDRLENYTEGNFKPIAATQSPTLSNELAYNSGRLGLIGEVGELLEQTRKSIPSQEEYSGAQRVLDAVSAIEMSERSLTKNFENAVVANFEKTKEATSNLLER